MVKCGSNYLIEWPIILVGVPIYVGKFTIALLAHVPFPKSQDAIILE